MTTPVWHWIQLTAVPASRYHHLAWFLYGCVEREQVLNLNACAAWWIKALCPASGQRGVNRTGVEEAAFTRDAALSLRAGERAVCR